MTPVDHSKIRPGAKVLTSAGEELFVRGCFLSPDGLVLMCADPGQVVCRNVPISLIVGVEENTQ